MAYAATTSTKVSKTRTEIDELLEKYGAFDRFIAQKEGKVVVGFCLNGRRVQFEIPMPLREKFKQREGRWGPVDATATQQAKAYEQACRQRWRSLLLSLKAKFIALEDGIESFEEAFLAHVVLHDGRTVYKTLTDKQGDNGPPLLPPKDP